MESQLVQTDKLHMHAGSARPPCAPDEHMTSCCRSSEGSNLWRRAKRTPLIPDHNSGRATRKLISERSPSGELFYADRPTGAASEPISAHRRLECERELTKRAVLAAYSHVRSQPQRQPVIERKSLKRISVSWRMFPLQVDSQHLAVLSLAARPDICNEASGG